MINLAKRETINKQSIWGNNKFISLWLGTSISNLTFHIFTLALPLLIYDMTKSTFAMGILKSIEIIPNILLGIFVGVLVDRFHRKRIMISSIGIKLITLSTIVALLYLSSLQLWMLYILTLFLYTSNYAFSNAYHSVMPTIMKKSQLTSANSAINFTNTFINIVGPSLAGMILFYISYQFGLMITILGFLILLLLVSLLTIPNHIQEEHKDSSFWDDVKEGWQQLVSTKPLWLATWMILGINMAFAASGTILVFYTLDILKVESNVIGYILTSSGIGGMLGAYTAKALGDRISRGPLFLLMLLVAALSQMLLFLSNQWYGLALGMFFAGFSATIINVHYATLRQVETPSHLLGRVAGTSSMIMKLAMPISFVLVGAIGEFIPVKYVFLISSVILIALFVFLVNSPLRSLK